MTPADKHIAEILTRYGEELEPNTWLVPGGKARAIKHPCIERMCAKAGVTFDMPEIVSADPNNVVIIVTGKLNDRIEWSFGEANPKNNKNAYVYSMAEKRGKDRVALKLIGLHGMVYSEEEADDFREGASGPTKSSAQSKKDGDWDKLKLTLDTADNCEALLKWPLSNAPLIGTIKPAWREQISELWRTAFLEAMASECQTPAEAKHLGVLYAKAFEALPDDYLAHAKDAWKQIYRELTDAARAGDGFVEGFVNGEPVVARPFA
ncbi:MAG: hypothetical protein H0W86_14310 [Armatimonadetes bacterium]|nr:hypothetical protein [Armatimonadota bacterium]